MSSYDTIFVTALRKRISERQNEVAGAVLTGNSTPEEYKLQCGHLRGLGDVADTLIDEVLSDMQRD